MSDCRRIAEWAAAYADGALAPAKCLTLEQHVAACAACRGLVEAERSGRALLRDASARAALRVEATLPPGFRTRCDALMRAQVLAAAGARRPFWRPRAVTVSLAALLMVFAASAILSLATRRSEGLLAAQLTGDHSWCFSRVAGVSHGDAPELERMLLDRYGWDMRIPPSSVADGVELIGAKRCYYAGGALPHVLYRVNGREMSLYMIEGEARPPSDIVTGGHRSRVWSRDNRTYVLLTPVGAGDMVQAASYVMQAH